jgi:hypothetical protein
MMPITEESGLHIEWMREAKDMTLDALPEFLRKLTQDYSHDYGTICHAIAAAAVAAAWAVEKSPQGGITGFQAGAVSWEMLKGWGGITLGETGSRIINFDDLLFPQYAEKFTTIPEETWEKLVAAASVRLKDAEAFVAPAVLRHWKSVASGNVPFGLKVA